jgi:hypothetical protein
MSTQTNISSLISPDILKNIKSSESIKAFGDQIKDNAKQKIITSATQSTLARLLEEKASLIKEGIAEIRHNITLLDLEKQNTPGKKIENGQTVTTPPEINKEEYDIAVAVENINYAAFQENLQRRKEDNQKAIDRFLKDPFAEQKKKVKEKVERIKKLKSSIKREKSTSKKERKKAVLKNAKKTIVPIITLLLTDRIADVISQNDIIKKLVDDTNKIITEANESGGDQVKLDNAKVTRDNALRVIQSNEDKINKINEQLQRVTIYINIFSTIVSILSAIPIPTSVPPGIGIPVNVITKIVQLLEKANKIVLALSALLPTIIVSLDKAIQILQDYKAQLLNINGQVDNLATPTPVAFGTDYGEYKGFKFALREEKDPKLEVRGNKRHFAIAINKQNIEQLKSDASFTLDPNDLIEQLKLVIDQQNLQG